MNQNVIKSSSANLENNLLYNQCKEKQRNICIEEQRELSNDGVTEDKMYQNVVKTSSANLENNLLYNQCKEKQRNICIEELIEPSSDEDKMYQNVIKTRSANLENNLLYNQCKEKQRNICIEEKLEPCTVRKSTDGLYKSTECIDNCNVIKKRKQSNEFIVQNIIEPNVDNNSSTHLLTEINSSMNFKTDIEQNENKANNDECDNGVEKIIRSNVCVGGECIIEQNVAEKRCVEIDGEEITKECHHYENKIKKIKHPNECSEFDEISYKKDKKRESNHKFTKEEDKVQNCNAITENGDSPRDKYNHDENIYPKRVKSQRLSPSNHNQIIDNLNVSEMFQNILQKSDSVNSIVQPKRSLISLKSLPNKTHSISSAKSEDLLNFIATKDMSKHNYSILEDFENMRNNNKANSSQQRCNGDEGIYKQNKTRKQNSTQGFSTHSNEFIASIKNSIGKNDELRLTPIPSCTNVITSTSIMINEIKKKLNEVCDDVRAHTSIKRIDKKPADIPLKKEERLSFAEKIQICIEKNNERTKSSELSHKEKQKYQSPKTIMDMQKRDHLNKNSECENVYVNTSMQIEYPSDISQRARELRKQSGKYGKCKDYKCKVFMNSINNKNDHKSKEYDSYKAFQNMNSHFLDSFKSSMNDGNTEEHSEANLMYNNSGISHEAIENKTSKSKMNFNEPNKVGSFDYLKATQKNSIYGKANKRKSITDTDSSNLLKKNKSHKSNTSLKKIHSVTESNCKSVFPISSINSKVDVELPNIVDYDSYMKSLTLLSEMKRRQEIEEKDSNKHETEQRKRTHSKTEINQNTEHKEGKKIKKARSSSKHAKKLNQQNKKVKSEKVKIPQCTDNFLFVPKSEVEKRKKDMQRKNSCQAKK